MFFAGYAVNALMLSSGLRYRYVRRIGRGSAMTTSKLPPSGGRRPPTIDLTATEIEGTSQQQGEPSAGPNAAQSAAEPPPRMEAEAPRMDTSAGESPSNESPAASPRGVSAAWLPAGIPWPLIGAGATAGAVVLVL